MSINLSISAVASHLSLQAPSSSHGGASAASGLDGDWCGTKVPHGPLPHGLASSLGHSLLDKLALNPQPLPPRQEGGASEHAGGLQQGGHASMDDDWCGTVPKHFPPLPPGPIGDLLSKFAGGK